MVTMTMMINERLGNQPLTPQKWIIYNDDEDDDDDEENVDNQPPPKSE